MPPDVSQRSTARPPQRPAPVRSMGGVLPRPPHHLQRSTTPISIALPSKAPAAPQNNAPVTPPEPPRADLNHLLEASYPDDPPLAEQPPKKPHKKAKKWIIILVTLIVLMIGAVVGAKIWYQMDLQPMTSDTSTPHIRVTIESGSSPDQIGTLLTEKKLIHSQLIFALYTRDKGVQSKLQAGTYNLRPSDSLADIVSHLVSGKTDEFNMTFLPGATLAEDRKGLIQAGYTAAEVDTALAQAYNHPALATKPASSDLEGYIYGETYSFFGEATVAQILNRTFDQLEMQVIKYDLVSNYQKQGLTLYQGITLASIIQREVANGTDQKQVAQVFLKRLREGTPLGSDVTFIYAAKKLGVPATPNLDSPYNTRINVGLPPGPISTPGLGALLSVADPAPGDFNYFLAGDDGKTYFANTYAEHQANIAHYCQKSCK